jgi:hypothetical protein
LDSTFRTATSVARSVPTILARNCRESEVVTVTPQYSADGVNWANAAEFVPDWTNGQIDTVPITLVANADGTSYKRFSLNGPLIRFSMIAATGPVTTTMLVVYE